MGLQIETLQIKRTGAPSDAFHQTVLPAGAGDHQQVTILQLLSRDCDSSEG